MSLQKTFPPNTENGKYWERNKSGRKLRLQSAGFAVEIAFDFIIDKAGVRV